MPRRHVAPDRQGRVGLAGHLLALVLAVLVPSLALGGATAWHLAGLYRTAFENRLSDNARALALAIDGEFETFQTAALALASSPLLRLEDIRPFRAWAVAITTRLGGTVTVHDASAGHPMILNTMLPDGAPPAGQPANHRTTAELIERSLLTRQTTVSNLIDSHGSDQPMIAIAAPTLDAQAVVVLSMPAERLARLLTDQGLSREATAAVTDQHNHIVAHARDQNRFVGTKSVESQAGDGIEAVRPFQSSGADGAPALYALRRLRRVPGWTVIVGEPLAAYRASWQRPLLVFLVGGSVALGLGIGLAAALGRRIRRPVQALLQRADAVAHGPSPNLPAPLPPSPVAEFEELRIAMERADAALRAGEAEFRAAFEQSAVPMQQTDCATGCFLRVNRAFAQLLDRPAESLIGRAFTEVTHPDDRETDLAGFWRMARGEVPSYQGEKRFIRPDGSVRWARIASSPVRDSEGRPVRTMAVVMDVTAQREAELAHRNSEAWMRLAQEAGGIGTWDANYETKTWRWSDQNYRIWGLEPGTMLARPFLLSLVHPDDRAAVEAQEAHALDPNGPQALELEFRIRRASDGAERRLASVGERILGAGGRVIGHRGVIQDVTERHQAAEALRHSEERLRLAQEAGGIGSWEWDPLANTHYWSESCHHLYGTDPTQPITDEAWRALILDEDRARVTAAMEAALFGNASAWETEFRITRARDGAVRWLNSRGSLLREPPGGPVVRVVGVAIDVTERRAAEERLRLLAREVDHRAKNSLAVVQAALRLTPKEDAARYAQAVEGRVNALARVHSLLAQTRWSGTRLQLLAEGELAPFLPARQAAPAGQAPRVVLEGPSVLLGPSAAQSISMALHELATNATKHGALSVPGGVVHLSWALDHAAGVLRMRWEESGSPVGAPPERRGFGSRVMEGTIRDQLGGMIRRDWTPTGLHCVMEVPLSRLASDLDEGASDRPLFSLVKE
ncbi:PAS domain S-box protein [Belnapia rosea]|uniref:histidine kinase n=1 Tax=Belnapia rosea TaxID=938405 RepID=A0A1G6NSN9_9PROT|nr:PAS domain S-box protein [Belnapia rosea]SDC71000.1 PAS domain S-box-containing protein [Belnapia rosea]